MSSEISDIRQKSQVSDLRSQISSKTIHHFINLTLYHSMVDVDYKAKLDEAIVQSDVVKIFDNLLTVGVER